MEKIFDRFSCASWLLINQNKFDEFIKQYKLELIANCKNWEASINISIEKDPVTASTILFYDLGKLIISSPINEYRIIEGKSIDYLYNDFCRYLSKNSEVYRFNIDIWIPTMLFELYKNEQLVRHCEYDVDNDSESIVINATGEKQKFEDEELKLPESEYGYNDFYYPIAIMNYLGICNEDIINNLNSQCFVYKLNDILIAKIKNHAPQITP